MSLNRRGSRSEGRLNISVQERIAETERVKMETAIAPHETTTSEPKKSVFCGMGGVTLVSSNTDPKEKLGLVRGSANVSKRPIISLGTAGSVPRANSVEHNYRSAFDHTDPLACTKFLVDAKTITIPITGSQPYVPSTLPEYKTMPSPSRIANVLPETTISTGLLEIFEETTDIGSSDSATTTPRPLTRHAHFVNHRAHSQSSTATTTTTTSARRSKFHKTRTASCSSSDASDDDSENRKKRAHKIVDSTKPLQQRRDSYDDSSDSQDPGTGTSASTATSLYPEQMVVGNCADEQHQAKDSNGGGSSTNSNGRQKSGQPMAFRRHRAGRRRAGETRLRESQSLNRITEVQESEPSTQQCKHFDEAHSTIVSPAVVAPHKPRGFSARLFHGFRKSDASSAGMMGGALPSTLEPSEVLRPKAPIATAEEEVEMTLGVELAKALKVTESKSSSTSKKLKMLGRYFQVT